MPFVYTDSKGNRRTWLPPQPKKKKNPFAGAEASGRATAKKKSPFAGVKASGTAKTPFAGAEASGRATARTTPAPSPSKPSRSSAPSRGQRQAARTIRRIRADQRRQAAANLASLPRREKKPSALDRLREIAEDIGDFATKGGVADRTGGVGPSMAEEVRRDPSIVADAASMFIPGAGIAKGALNVARGTRDLLKAAKATETATATAAKVKRTETAAGAMRAAVAADARKAGRALKRKGKRIKETPSRVRRGARNAKKLKTKEGRKQARRAAYRAARRRPVMTALGASAGLGAAGYRGPFDVNKRSQALVEGHVEAIRDDPAKVAKTTARAIPGSIAGLAGLVAAPAISAGRAASSAAHEAGIPGARGYTGKDIVSPITSTAKAMGEGLAEMASDQLSGDPERVKESVQDEVGAWLVLPSARAVRRVRGSETYKTARAAPRRWVASGREVRREREAARPPEQRRKRKPPVRDSERPGNEEYVIQPLGRVLENRRGRIRISREAQRMAAIGAHEGRAEAKPVVKAAENLEKRYPGTSNALATVAYHGLNPRSPKFDEQLAKLERDLKQMDPSELPPDFIGDSRAIEIIRENPEALRSPEFEALREAYRDQARRTETSARAKYMGIAALEDVPLPEQRMREKGVEPISPDNLRAMRAEVRNMIDQRALLNREINRMEPGTMEHFEAIERYRALDEGIRQRTELMALHGRAAGQAQREFLDEVREAQRRGDYEEPSYVKDVDRSDDRPTIPHVGFSAHRAMSRRLDHFREGTARRRGSVDRSFETLVRESIIGPRVKRAQHRFINDVVEAEALRLPVSKGPGAKRLKQAKVLTTNEVSKAAKAGLIHPETHVVLHSQHFRSAALDPHREGPLGGLAGYEALREALAETGDFQAQMAVYRRGDVESDVRDRAADPGRKYVVLPREVGEELLHQITPPPNVKGVLGNMFGDGAAQRWNNAFSRAVLGYSPSWALAQIAAEGLPLVAAIASPNPRHWKRVIETLKKERELPPADRAALDGTVGESLGTMGIPQIDPWHPNVVVRANNAMRRNPIYRALVATVKGRAFHGFDRWKGGKYRKVLEAVQADREMQALQRGLGGILKMSDDTAKAMKAQNLTDFRVYVARNPQLARQMERYLDDVMGNWRALTRFEAKFAPAVAFFPFVRYSLRWTFNSFPKRHPARAQILYFMAQLNANELEKILGSEQPLDFVNYAFPVLHYSDDHKGVMPGGRRLAPGANALVEAIGRANIDQAFTVLPFFAAGAQIATGKNLYFGESQEGQYSKNEAINRGLMGLHQLLSYPTFSRFLNVPDTVLNFLGADKTTRDPGIGRDAFSEKSIRSNVFPYLPQDGEAYRRQVELDKAYKTRNEIKKKRVVPVKPGPLDYGAAGNDPEKIRELERQAREADEAQAVIDRIRGKRPEDPEFEEGMKRYWEQLNESQPSRSGPFGLSGGGGGGLVTPRKQAPSEAPYKPFGL